MIVPPSHVNFLKKPLSFWLATASLRNIPEPVKCTGIKFDAEKDVFTCFAPLKFMATAFNHLKENPMIALVGVDVHTYEGYQYKGQYLAHRECTEAEVDFQSRYMKDFTDILDSFGHPGPKIYNSYLRPPFVAIDFRATQVFDQSPRKGTGEQIQAQ